MRHQIVTHDKIESINFTPTVILGFYPSSQNELFHELYETLSMRFPNVDVIGCSSESNIYNELPFVDIEDEHTCVFLCLDMKKEAYQIVMHTIDNIQDEIEVKYAEYAGLLLCSHYFSMLEVLIKQLQEGDHGCQELLGAIAGVSSGSSKNGTVFYNGQYYEDHILLWLVDQKTYCFEGRSSNYFQPVGFEMEVTKAEGTILYAIDNRPALEVFEEIIGEISEKAIASFDYPFFLKEHDHKSFMNASLCSIRSINRNDGSIELYRSVQVHDKLKIGVAVGRNERGQKLQELKIFKRRKNAVALLFNCVGVKANLNTMEFVYLMELKKALHMPFLGFHSFGEIGKSATETVSVLQNQTISIVVLSEREENTVCI